MNKSLIVLCLTILLISVSGALAMTRFVTIGTGGVTGVYYPPGGAISKIVNSKRSEYGMRVMVEATAGSVYNINAIMAGDLDFGVVQSDRQYQAYYGLADWDGKPQKKLRSVFSIHPESVTIVAGVDSGIRTVADLKGKSVNIGNLGSGQRGNAIDLLATAGLDFSKDIKAEELKPAEMASILQDERLDAFIYTVGHPNGLIKEAVAGPRKVRFVEIPDDVIRKLTRAYAYYTPVKIPVKMYPGIDNRQPVKSFGVKATLCTSADVPMDVVYAITKEVFENIEEFKKLHPAYEDLTRRNMLEGLSAPMHPGAIRYYKEVGLLQ